VLSHSWPQTILKLLDKKVTPVTVMARVFSALALARVATALLDGHIDVVVHKNVDIKVPKVNNNPFLRLYQTSLPYITPLRT